LSEATSPGGPPIATILFAWELGGGLGHLQRLAPVARLLHQRGHRVLAVLRDPARGQDVFGPDVACRPAPAFAPAGPAELGSFADVLGDAGWDEATTLKALVGAWGSELEREGPDVVVMDHSPTCLLASQGAPVRRVLLGTGFACPPDVEPLPSLVPAPRATAASVERERRVRDHASGSLEAMGRPPLARLSALFQRVDRSLLATWPELDHHGARPSAEYVGVWPGAAGRPPTWPEADGPRVFAYLKPFRALPALLRLLDRAGLAVLAYVDGLAPAVVERLGTPRVRLVQEPVALEEALRQSALAVLHAGHGSAATALRLGCPVLAIPLQREQLLVARRLVEAGAAQVASSDAPAQMATALQRLLGDARFARAARRFADRHAGYDAEAGIRDVAARIEALAPAGEPG